MKAGYTKRQLQDTVFRTRSKAGALRALGLATNGTNYTMLDRRLEAWGIDTSHWPPKGTVRNRPKQTLTELLVEGSVVKSSTLRVRLLEEGLLKPVCSNTWCPTRSMSSWGEDQIPLQLDHVNGDRRNNRIENLRLLCPNCHCLTPTWGSRNRTGTRKVTRCMDCGEEIFRASIRCLRCAAKRRERVCWPANEDLKSEIEKTSIAVVSRRLGVSFNAVKKRLQRHI